MLTSLTSLWQSIQSKLQPSKRDPQDEGDEDLPKAKSKPKAKSSGKSKGSSKFGRKPLSEVDSQWAAAIEAMNAEIKPRRTMEDEGSSSGYGNDDDEEKPTIVATKVPPLGMPLSQSGPPTGTNPPTGSASPAQLLANSLRHHDGLNQISAQEFEELAQYLNTRSRLDPDTRKASSLDLARRIKATISLAKLPPKTTADTFLEVIHELTQSRFS